MGLQVKGLNVRGIRISGSEFLEPPQIVTCQAWYKWKTNLTLVGSAVSNWSNQVGATSGVTAMSGGAGQATKRPVYDSVTGIIRGDGTDDYLSLDTLVQQTDNLFTFVTAPAIAGGSSQNLWSRDMADGDAIDANALNFRQYTTYLQKDVASGTGSVMQSNFAWGAALSAPAAVVSLRKDTFFINGVQTPLAITNGLPLTGAQPSRMVLFGQARGTGGVGGVPSNPINVSRIGIYEWCWHTGLISNLQISKLHNYFKQKHGIL